MSFGTVLPQLALWELSFVHVVFRQLRFNFVRDGGASKV